MNWTERPSRLVATTRLVTAGVVAVVLAACSSPPSAGPPPTSAVPPTSRPVTSITTSTTTTVPSTEVSPTLVVPVRSDGLAALGIEPGQLDGVTILVPEVIQLLPHDRTAVTEGLSLLDEERLLESTGLYGRSSRRIIDVASGALLGVEALRPELYATGVASVSGEVGIQVTELEELVQLFDTASLELIEERSIDLQLTAVCRDGDGGPLRFATADGQLHVADPDDFTVLETVTPRLVESPIPPMTDLVCVEDQVWGIVGATAVLVQIDPTTGSATAVADLAELSPAGLAANDVLSGAAYRPQSDSWFVTGRRWDVLYEIQLRP